MLRTVPAILALVAGSALLAPALDAQSPRTINLVGNDTLTYSLPTITAKPAEMLKVVLRTMSMQPASQMAHNFVLLKPGVDVDAFITAAALARKEAHLPGVYKTKIFVASDLAEPGSAVSVTFKAPGTPGRYSYVCSYPGHYNGGMKGVLVVKVK
jgi:azurin